jgi:hypothetical protein
MPKQSAFHWLVTKFFVIAGLQSQMPICSEHHFFLGNMSKYDITANHDCVAIKQKWCALREFDWFFGFVFLVAS